MNLTLQPISGLIPKLSDIVSPSGTASIAKNVNLENGTLKPLRDVGSSVGVSAETIYLDKNVWRTWDKDVDVVRSPVSKTRIIYTDGILPKIRDGDIEYPLGIPVPTQALSIATVDKTSVDFTLQWHWFYEETNGVQVDNDLSVIVPTVDIIGKQYSLATIPAKVHASATARFMMWCKMISKDGEPLGSIYPDKSLSVGMTDAIYNGAIISATYTPTEVVVQNGGQTSQIQMGLDEYGDPKYITVTTPLIITSITTTSAVFLLKFDTSRASDYNPLRIYVYTYLRRWPSGGDDEGAPSPVSVEKHVNPSQDAQLSGITSPPSGYGITHIRIYRTISGLTGTSFFYVTEIASGTTTFTDTLSESDISLAGGLVSIQYDPPPSTLKGLKYHPGGFLVGFDGIYLYSSEPYRPHAWPSNSIPCGSNIIGIGVYGQTIVVVTEKNPFVLSGSSPSTMNKEEVHISLSGTTKDAIIETGHSVIYSSQSGLVEIPGGSIISENLYTKEQWKLLDIKKMVWYDNSLFLFNSKGTKNIKIIQGRPILTETDDVITGYFFDVVSDTLYVSIKDSIRKWGVDKFRTYSYRTKSYLQPIATAPVGYRLTSSDFVKLSFYNKENLIYTCNAIPGDRKWFPVLPRNKEWSVQLEGDIEIEDFQIL